MTLLLNCSLSCPSKLKPSTVLISNTKPFTSPTKHLRAKSRLSSRNNTRVKAFFFNPIDEPILKEALKEPVAFMGGVFAGLLRLDLNDDPLKEWVSRTVEASGITTEEIEAQGSKTEEAPEQIEIE